MGKCCRDGGKLDVGRSPSCNNGHPPLKPPRTHGSSCSSHCLKMEGVAAICACYQGPRPSLHTPASSARLMTPQIYFWLAWSAIAACSGHPHHVQPYQESRQIFYQQPLPLRQAPLYLPQSGSYQQQLPLIPNNVDTGVRYGQQSVIYVVPQGSQVLYQEGATSGEEGATGSIYESFINLINGANNYFPWGEGSRPVEAPAPPPAAPVENPEKLEQGAILVEQPQQQLPLQQQQLQQPQIGQTQLQQEAQKQKLMLMSGGAAQFYQQRPSMGSPSANLIYYSFPQQTQQADRMGLKVGHGALAFQKLFFKSGQEQNNASTGESTAQGPSGQEDGQDNSETETGPTLAQVKPQAIAVAGQGGVAAAAPVGTAVVGPGGMALSAPSATALAGTQGRRPPQTAPESAVQSKIRQAYRAASFYPAY